MNKKIPKTTAQALGWLKRMGIEVTRAKCDARIYEFEYNDILMLITIDSDNDNELSLNAPVFLTGKSDEKNKEIFETAKYMTSDTLKDFIVEYVHKELSYVGQTYVRPKHVRILRRYQLVHMLDQIRDAHDTFLLSTLIAAAPPEAWLGEAAGAGSGEAVAGTAGGVGEEA